MKIAIFTPEYVSEKNFDGGLANYSFRLAKSLNTYGHYAEVFTLSNIDGHTTHEGIRVNKVASSPSLEKINSYKLLRFLVPAFHITLQSLAMRKAFLSREVHINFDVIQVPNYQSLGIAMIFNKVPLITRISSYEPVWRKYSSSKYRLADWLKDQLEIIQLTMSKEIYAPSQYVRHLFPKKFSRRIKVVRPPYFTLKRTQNLAVVNKYKQKPFFLFFGSLYSLKGADLIVEAIPQILPSYPNVHFLFVGKPGNISLENCLKKNPEKVFYEKSLPHSALFPLIKNAIAVIIPSRHDNLPNSCIESMAEGKIVIATNGASLNELIQHHDNGFLFRSNDANDLAEKIIQVLKLSSSEKNRVR